VQVSVDRGGFEAGDAADNNLLAQNGALFDDDLGQRLAVDLGGEQGVDVGSAGLDGDSQDLVGELGLREITGRGRYRAWAVL